MKKNLFKAFLGLVTLFAIPSVANAANNMIVESPLMEMNMQDLEDNKPGISGEVISTTKNDGTVIMIVTVTVTLNGEVVSQHMEFVVVGNRPES